MHYIEFHRARTYYGAIDRGCFAALRAISGTILSSRDMWGAKFGGKRYMARGVGDLKIITL